MSCNLKPKSCRYSPLYMEAGHTEAENISENMQGLRQPAFFPFWGVLQGGVGTSSY